MRKKGIALALAVLLALTGCGQSGQAEDKQEAQEEIREETAEQEAGENENGEDEAGENEAGEEAKDGTEKDIKIRVGSLKGPTSMGLVSLMDKAKNGETEEAYSFTMEAGADALLASVMKGELDIALIPANAAAIWYQKLEGAVTVVDINTLGVLYMVTAEEGIDTLESLEGRTVALTGKGTTPDYALQYLLSCHGLGEGSVTLEYKSEAAEVVAALAEGAVDIGLLPQPYATAACVQNENLKETIDLTAEWDAVQGEEGSRLVTGVTVVRTEFLEEHPDEVADFMAEHKESAAFANENPKEAAELVAALGIVEKAAVAEKAIPKCNITYIDEEEMKESLGGYLKVLYGQDPAMVGGELPGEEFYYIP